MSSATETISTASAERTRSSWFGVGSLGLGIFAIVMSEFLPASLLPRIAFDLGVSDGVAGQMVTMTALAAALSALLISVVLPRADRRRVMIGLMALTVVSDLAVALAPNLVVLLGGRLLLGVALGGFWAMATAMAAHLVRADHLGRALTIVNAGVSAATIVAVPLGAWLGEVWGWRSLFLVGAGVAVLALLAQAVTLPRVSAPGGSGLRALGSTLRSPIVIVGLVAVLLVFGGHFGGYTYIRPAAESAASVDAGTFALLLLAFGLANFLGTAISGPLLDRALRAGVLLFPAVAGVGMLVMLISLVTGGSIVGLFVAVALWGFGFGGVPTSVLTWGARVEPTRLEQIGGLIVTVCNVAVAVGAVAGGLLVDGVSLSAPLFAGGIAAIAGGVIIAILPHRR